MKLTIIGSGNVGATAAFLAALKGEELGINEIVLGDIVNGVPQGKALDINQSMAVFNSNVKVTGTNAYEPTADSDIVVITAGVPRKPGMSRDDLIETNASIVKAVVEKVVEYSKNPWIIVVTNPLDAMVCVAKKTAKSEKVIGMAGTLDSARLRHFISAELKEDVSKVDAMTLGSHGDDMVPLISAATVEGKQISKFMAEKKINEVIEKTQKGGAEILNLLGTSAYYAPAAAIIQIIGAIDSDAVVPICAEYKGKFAGIPATLKNNKIIVDEKTLGKMSPEEKKLFDQSVLHVDETIYATERILEKQAEQKK